MPNTKSAKKRLRQNFARRDANRAVKSAMRTRIRKVREAVDANNIEEAEELFKAAARSLDRAGAKNIIHRNAAARTKSRLSKLILKAKQPAAAE